MSNFKAVDPKEIAGNAISLFDDGWALLTAGTADKYNTMTISCGEMGCLWNLPVCTVFVRPCRYTYGFLQESSRFTLSLFDPQSCRKELTAMGTVSGRDMAKMTKSGLTPFSPEAGLTAYSEAKAVLVLKKLYDHQFDASHLPQEIKDRSYKGVAGDDLHRLYICQIEKAYIKE